MGRLHARWLVLVLGGILLATTVLFGLVTNAEAQGQDKGQGKGKAQGQVQGQVQENSRAQGGGAAEGGRGQVKCLIEHTTGEGTTKTLRIAAPAVRAHVANHNDSLAEESQDDPVCVAAAEAGQDRDGGGTDDSCGIVGATAAATPKDTTNTILTIDVAAETPPTDPTNWTITLEDEDKKSVTLSNMDQDVSLDVNPDDNLALTVPTALLTQAGVDPNTLKVTEATGIECNEDTTAEAPASSIGTTTLSGTATATESGEPALKTSSGKTIKLSAKTDKGEQRLDALAKKDAKVKVRGKESGDTLEVTKVKSAKAKKK